MLASDKIGTHAGPGTNSSSIVRLPRISAAAPGSASTSAWSFRVVYMTGPHYAIFNGVPYFCATSKGSQTNFLLHSFLHISFGVV
jgi:hypothetical protein